MGSELHERKGKTFNCTCGWVQGKGVSNTPAAKESRLNSHIHRQRRQVQMKTPPPYSETSIVTQFHYDHPSGSDLSYTSTESGVQGELWIPRYRFLNSSVPPDNIEVTITIREKR